MKRKAVLLVIIPAIFMGGCLHATPTLTGEPTPPPVLSAIAQEVEPEEAAVDALGVPLELAEHYMRYVALHDVRVYQVNLHALLDGVFQNNYVETLQGRATIEFMDDSGRLVASCTLYTAGEEDTLVLEPGENIVYAEIAADVDVQMMDFEFTVTEPFLPIG